MIFRGYEKQTVEISLSVPEDIRAACKWRFSGRLFDKPVRVLSLIEGRGSPAICHDEAGVFQPGGFIPPGERRPVDRSMSVAEALK